MVWGFIFVTILAICVVAGVLIFLRNRDRQILLASELYEQTRDLLYVSHSMFYCGDELVSEYCISCAVSSEEAFLEFEPDDYMRAYVAGHHEFIEHIMVCSAKNGWAKKTVWSKFESLLPRSRFTCHEIQLCRAYLREQLDKIVDCVSCRLCWEYRNADAFVFQTHEKVYDNRTLHDMLDEVRKD